MNRAVFLDRDGVLNRAIIRNGKPYPPSCLAELEILPGAREALTRLRHEGFRLIVVTNQPDVARGTQTRASVEQMNGWLKARLPLDEFRVCYHDDNDQCSCRKPAPGLIVEAAKDWDVDLSKSFVIGDRWRDIEAGCRAGCITVFIEHDYVDRHPENPAFRSKSLSEAVWWVLSQIKQ